MTMLATALGIRLVMLVGKTVPKPAPVALLRTFTRIEVTNDARGDDGFQMTFALSKQKTGEYDLLESGALDPDTRVILGVAMGAMPEPLIDGVIYHHQLQPGVEPGASTLTVMGRDLRVMLDLKEVNMPFMNQTDSTIVQAILGQPAYARYGLVPDVTPTSNVRPETELIVRQHETDLRFLQALARRNQFVFYVEPLTIGTNTAYWGRPESTTAPQPALTHNLGSASNVTELYFSRDALGPVSAAGSFTDPVTRQSVAIPPLPGTPARPLAATPEEARRTELLRDTARISAAEAATDLQAALANAPRSVRANGRLDSGRYGHVLRARRAVEVRGVGARHGGAHYVSRVKHLFTRTSYTQEFTLERDGTGALQSTVTP